MFDSSVLFWMILGILVLITVCLLLIAYEMNRGDVGRRSLSAKKRSLAMEKCAFFFGFLSEQPIGKPIPEECFGCILALPCIKATKPPSGGPIGQPIPVS